VTLPTVLLGATIGATAFVLAAEETTAGALALMRLAICGIALGVAAATDLTEHRVPNRVVLPAAAGCAALTLVGDESLHAVMWGLALAASLLVLSLVRPSVLGMGDVKLVLLVAVGLDGNAASGILLGIVFAGLAGLALLALSGRRAWRRALPLAPFLAIGALAALLL